MTSTEGILDGAAKARVLEAPKVAPEAACMPMKAAADSLVKSFIFLIIMMMCSCNQHVQQTISQKNSDDERMKEAHFFIGLQSGTNFTYIQ